MSLSDVLDVLVPGGFILLVLALIFIKNPSPGEVPGFEVGARSDLEEFASVSRPPRETRCDSLTGRPAGQPARPAGPGREVRRGR